ncbi:MAG TPA: helix-turn-helix domain-containing protein, partial [Candidatus Binatus sp.]|nr:helix-turn-helix domain-containing protein [Candidatus Binatus sp.]
VQGGKFRQDLFYRLNVIRIELPALRRRRNDIPLLVNHFLQKFASSANHRVDGVAADAMAALKAYEWPGNIRELEHTLERAVLLGKGSVIGIDDLPAEIGKRAEQEIVLAQAMVKHFTLADLEREYIGKVLETTQGNKTEAAKILGVDRTTLYRKLEEYKIKA